jgi:ABC-type transporter Mla maintaining outer membrane lipid asymmetry ATPase subunit MlaF
VTAPASIPGPLPALAMRGVTVPALSHPGASVAIAVDWTVARGEFWVIAGPQRAGKTDFLMFAAGLSAPLAGEYRVGNERMPVFEEARLAERLRVGLVFEGGKLFPHLTVAENVALPVQYHEDLEFAAVWPRVAPLLEWLGLEEVAASFPATLSRDLQSRAGLARALMHQPELLCLDNPLARLDARGLAWWRDFLGALNRGHPAAGGRPVTLVVTTDNLRLWRGTARRFASLGAQRFTVIGDEAALERAAGGGLNEWL